MTIVHQGIKHGARLVELAQPGGSATSTSALAPEFHGRRAHWAGVAQGIAAVHAGARPSPGATLATDQLPSSRLLH